MSEDPKGQAHRAWTGSSKAIALGAGVGMIFGAASGNAGAGMVLGAAFGLVFPGVFERMRQKDNGAEVLSDE